MVCKLYFGQCNSLDVFCKCYEIDNFYWELYGVLLDVEILVDVYFMMIGGQINLSLVIGDEGDEGGIMGVMIKLMFVNCVLLKVICVLVDEFVEYEVCFKGIDKESDGNCIWLKLF